MEDGSRIQSKIIFHLYFWWNFWRDIFKKKKNLCMLQDIAPLLKLYFGVYQTTKIDMKLINRHKITDKRTGVRISF